MITKKGFKLQIIISVLITFSLIISFFINWYSATNALRKSLTQEYLTSNYNYARKLALNTYDLLNVMQKNLITASQVAGIMEMTQKELDIWKSANGFDFNSILILDKEGVVQRVSPSIISRKGELGWRRDGKLALKL